MAPLRLPCQAGLWTFCSANRLSYHPHNGAPALVESAVVIGAVLLVRGVRLTLEPNTEGRGRFILDKRSTEPKLLKAPMEKLLAIDATADPIWMA